MAAYAPVLTRLGGARRERAQQLFSYLIVNRRAVSQPANLADIDWNDAEIEVVETAERALVSKTARVIEEIELKKVGTDHIETIHEKLRRQQAEFVRMDANGRPVR